MSGATAKKASMTLRVGLPKGVPYIRSHRSSRPAPYRGGLHRKAKNRALLLLYSPFVFGRDVSSNRLSIDDPLRLHNRVDGVRTAQ